MGHVLSQDFKRIRHHGLLAPGAKGKRLATARQLLRMPAPHPIARDQAEDFMRRVAAIDERGGVWRVIFSVTGEPGRFAIGDPSRDIVLQGITFLQTELAGRQLIAHGPKSIYERLPRLVEEATAGER